MKVLIHALGATMGGALRHLTNFLPELGRQDGLTEYVVLVRSSFPCVYIPGNVRLAVVPDGEAAGWASRLAHDIVRVPARLKREGFAAIVTLTNIGPIWSPVPHIVYQRNSLYFCPRYLARIGARMRLETELRRRLAIASVMRADVIVTPSDAMRDMIHDAFPGTRGRSFRTLYHGFERDSLGGRPREGALRLMDSRNGMKLFYPAHAGFHKGFEVLFDSLALLRSRRSDFCLFATIEVEEWPEVVLEYQRRIERLGLRDHVVFVGRVPQCEMGAFYERADLMVYPSFCESFGFALIEAIGCGVPIVAADTPVNLEMCGEGAIYYSPFDSAAAAAAIDTALGAEARERLRRAGKARFESFDWGWRRYTGEFLDLLGTVV